MKKKLISLINNERTNVAINSAKASDVCTVGATDFSYTDEEKKERRKIILAATAVVAVISYHT